MLQMSSQYGEHRFTSCWDLLVVLGHPCKFQRVSRLGSVTAHESVVGVSQTLRPWTEGATNIRQGGHHVGHWPTFLASNWSSVTDDVRDDDVLCTVLVNWSWKIVRVDLSLSYVSALLLKVTAARHVLWFVTVQRTFHCFLLTVVSYLPVWYGKN